MFGRGAGFAASAACRAANGVSDRTARKAIVYFIVGAMAGGLWVQRLLPCAMSAFSALRPVHEEEGDQLVVYRPTTAVSLIDYVLPQKRTKCVQYLWIVLYEVRIQLASSSKPFPTCYKDLKGPRFTFPLCGLNVELVDLDRSFGNGKI